jgi:hypothetical protein
VLHDLLPGVDRPVRDKVALVRVRAVLDLGLCEGKDPEIEVDQVVDVDLT